MPYNIIYVGLVENLLEALASLQVHTKMVRQILLLLIPKKVFPAIQPSDAKEEFLKADVNKHVFEMSQAF